MEQKRIVIVGGGAAGLTAAIAAADAGAAVTVLEHNDRMGRKLSVTGNGKCNFANKNMQDDSYRGSRPEFIHQVLRQWSVEDTLKFFQSLGIWPQERNGYFYPRSGQASSVTEALEAQARYKKVKLKTREHVKDIVQNGGTFSVLTETWNYPADRVILACGSCASSVPGADGSGYELARRLGHRILKPLPALTALRCRGNCFSAWAGVRTEGIVTLYIDGQKAASARGELQLTDYGISGIPVFQVSRYGIRALEEGAKVTAVLNFLPELTLPELEAFLQRRRVDLSYKSKKELLSGVFPDKLCQVLLSGEDLCQSIHAFSLPVKGAHSMEQAQVCSGGVDTSQVCPQTMESLLIPGLYFAGELLDVDGACGGYNLQWAWASAMTAGCASAGHPLPASLGTSAYEHKEERKSHDSH